MELSKKQREIVETEHSKVVVLSSSASGKTRTLTARLSYLLDKGIDPTGIVMITFTNMAAEEMRERIGAKGANVFIGTIHAYANYLLSSAGISTASYIKEEDFDAFFDLIKKNPRCIRHVDYLLLDEAQDSTSEQFEFMLDMIKPDSFFLVGDLRQSIYGFKQADPEFLAHLMYKKDVKTYSLNENYRNAPEILKFAKHIISKQMDDDSVAMRKDTPGIVRQGSYTLDDLATMLKRAPKKGDWFFLCRTNAQIEFVSNFLEKRGIPCSTFKKAKLTNAQLQKKMAEDKVKVLTMHTSKGLERNNVIVYGAQWYSPEEIRLNYVAATRARNILIWVNKPKTRQKWI